jgi:hypothetical protein
MLERLLKRIADGGIQSQAHLARELNVSEDLIAQMLLDLERMGYIRRLEDSCDSHCAHCDLASSCAGRESVPLWTLTDKKLPF